MATAGSDRTADEPSAGSADGTATLLDRYDLLLVDLDGVAYLGDRPIDGAADALRGAREHGVAIEFVTNNASRPPGEVAAALTAMGIEASPTEIVTSAVGAAAVLAGRLAPGAHVLVVGGAGVREALIAVGLVPVDDATDEPVAVLQGFAPEVGWRSLAEASIAIAAGAAWIATNADLTLPSPRGPLPGNGSLVAALAAATGQRPEVIGKPEPALFEAAARSHPSRRPLVVGDRLDTDIAGARAAGLPSLCVLSGVTGPRDLVAASPDQRPDYIGRDLRAIGLVHPAVTGMDGVGRSGGRQAELVDGVPVVTPIPPDSADNTSDGLDGLRALCGLVWSLVESADINLDSLDLD
jgi:glycerol-1-phosphatase